MPKWIITVLYFALTFSIFNALAVNERENASVDNGPRLLILISAAYGRPGIETFNKGVFDAWKDAGYSVSNISTHYLDLNQNPNINYRPELANFILEKERDKHYDFILLVQQDAVNFYTTYLPSLAKNAKLIAAFSNLDEAWLNTHRRQGLNMADSLDYESTIDTALALYPKTERLVIINGATPSDKKPLAGLLAFMTKYPHIHIETTDHLTFDQLLIRISNLETNSLILRSSYGSDHQGNPKGKTPIEIGVTLSEHANVPSFVLYYTAIGNAPVSGGHVVVPEEIGKTLIRRALEDNHWPKDSALRWIPINSTPIYDISELLRTGAALNSLPANTVRLNEPHSFIKTHFKTILISSGIILLLCMCLLALLIERRYRKRQSEALSISKTQLLTNLEHTPHVAVQWFDKKGVIQYWNPASERLYGWKKEEVLGRELTETFLSEQDKAEYFKKLNQLSSTRTAITPYETKVLCKDGSLRTVLTTSFIMPMGTGELGFASMDLDITEQKHSEKHLLLLASVFNNASEGIVILDEHRKIKEVNAAFCKLSGFKKEELVGQSPDMLYYQLKPSKKHPIQKEVSTSLAEHQHWSGEMEHKRKDGQVFTSLVTINMIYDECEGTQRYIALMSDITELKQKQVELERVAHFDAVTDLPNRVLFSDRLNQSISQLGRHQDERLAVIYIDLDGFKAVNDNHGHMLGDKLLQLISNRMKNVLRETDTLARLGGDEFAAVLTNLHEHKDVERVLDALLQSTSDVAIIDELEIRVSASIGVVFVTPETQNTDPDILLRHADQAMYKAKNSGKNKYCFFDDNEDKLEKARQDDLKRLKNALQNNEFELYLQPKVNTSSNAIIGAEALIRWQHPEKGLVPPGAFLPLLADHPLSVDIGFWVIRTALSQQQQLKSQGYYFPISVNVDGFQLSHPDFVTQVQSILKEYPDYQQDDLEFEVLESSALDDIDAVSQVIQQCREIGIQFSLDDFGTGYSSLNYLKRLPVQTLKIDQSFIRNMLDNQDDLAIIQGVLGLAHAFNRNVIAEGVESNTHVQVLKTIGCEMIQGYVIAKPLAFDSFLRWCKEWSSAH